MLEKAEAGRSALLIAPTGGGKTLAGFLPSLVDLDGRSGQENGLHTLYISPLKALTTDIARNLQSPVEEMALDLKVETRTGDTPQNRRQRQRIDPPDMLLTTPESLALLLSYPDAPKIFAGLTTVVIDELHALAGAKRGQLLALGLARLARHCPRHRASSACRRRSKSRRSCSTISVLQRSPGRAGARRSRPGAGRLRPPARRPPALGRPLRHLRSALACIETIKSANTTLVFVNTRAQAEVMFRELWRVNERQPADRAASRLARGGAAPSGRSGDGVGQAEGDRLHQLARSRHRLGRRRSRRADRCPQGCVAHPAAHRPRQPSLRSAERAPFWCRAIASRCWNAVRRWTRSGKKPSTACRPIRAVSTCSPNTSQARPAAVRSTPSRSIRKW